MATTPPPVPTFEDVFFSFRPDIFIGVLRHLSRKTLDEAEVTENLTSIIAYFTQNNKLFELLTWTVSNELRDAKSPSLAFRRSSVFNNLIHLFLTLDVRDDFVAIVDRLVAEVQRRDLAIDLTSRLARRASADGRTDAAAPDEPLAERDVRVIKELLGALFQRIFDLKPPESFKCFVCNMARVVADDFPEYAVPYVRLVVFDRFFLSLLISRGNAATRETTAQTVKSLTCVLRWVFSDDFRFDQEWKRQLQDFKGHHNRMLTSWIAAIFSLGVEKRIRLRWAASIKQTRDIKQVVLHDTDAIRPFLSTEAADALSLLLDASEANLPPLVANITRVEDALREQESSIYALRMEIALLAKENKELEDYIRFLDKDGPDFRTPAERVQCISTPNGPVAVPRISTRRGVPDLLPSPCTSPA